MKKAIILFNLGGPDKLENVKPFLFNLFNDPAILNLPTFLRYPLAKLISNRRAPVAKKIYEWKEQIENQQLLVRDIIDIDSTYEDFEALEDDDALKINKKSKNKEIKKDDEKKTEETPAEDDEFNVSLAKMEEEIKPKILTILDSLNKNY